MLTHMSVQVVALVSSFYFLPLMCVESLAVNQPPILRLSLSLNEGLLVKVPEDTPVNSLIGIVEVKDEESATVTCTVNDPYVGLVRMNIDMYKVDLVRPLDREIHDTLEVLITCSDSGQPPMTSTSAFSVVVHDVNDNAPVFSQAFYTTTVQENEERPTKLDVALEVTDQDLGENAQFEYTLDAINGEKNELFEIDPEKGDIYTLAPLDHEEFQEINLIVHAIDFGLPPRSSSTHVKIQVGDVNDNHPMILTEELQIREGLPAMAVVGKVEASDADSGDNARVRFRLADSGDSIAIPPFLIGQDGTIRAAVPLDRERRASYILHITATDQGTPPLSNHSTVTISVLDINDNAPIILRPQVGEDFGHDDDRNDSNALAIDLYCPGSDRLVYAAYAQDYDQGENGRVTYSITFINDQVFDSDSLFNINPNTGQIQLQRCVRQTDTPSQILTLSFRDNGDPSLEVIATLNVSLNVDFASLTKPIPVTTTTVKTAIPVDSAIPHYFNNHFLLAASLIVVVILS